MQKTFNAGTVPSFTFPIGDSAEYAPVALTNLIVNTGGGVLTASTTPASHPSLGFSTLDPSKDVNRYWTLTPSGSFGTYGGTFNYPSADATGNASVYDIQQWNGTSWSSATVSGTPTTTSASFSGQSGFGDFAIGDQLLSAWHYRKQITINHTKVSGTVAAPSGFPVLVNLTSDADLIAHAQANGFDLFFTASDGTTVLPYEREQYASGTLLAWAKVPTLSSTAHTVLYLYYGNTAATDQQQPAGVWDANFQGVWHLKEATGTTSADSTANGNSGTDQGSPTLGASGKIGSGVTLSGTTAYISTKNQQSNPQTLTASLWFKTTSTTGHKVLGFEDAQTGTGGVNYDRQIWVGTDGKAYGGINPSSIQVFSTTGTYNDGSWHHAAITVSGGSTKYFSFYVDGSLVNSATTTGPQVYNGYWRIGSYKLANWTAGTDGYFNGSVDEVRVSSIDRSADWIKTEYNNQNSPATFYSVGGEQVLNSTVTVSSSANPSAYGAPVTFTAVVSGTGPTPTGTVQFQVNGVNFGSPVTLDGSGSATSGAISTLALGDTPVTALYSGDSNYSSDTGLLLGGQTVTSASGDYRSFTTGNWSAAGTWQTWNGSAWVAASSAPSGSSGVNITVQSGHTVTDDAAVSLLGTLIVQGTLSFSGSGAITVGSSGILNNSGTVNSSATTLILNSGATYQHNFTTTAGTIPTAAWNAGSTCAIIGYTSNTSAPGGLGQSFRYVAWDCPNQTGAINLGGSLTTVLADFTVTSTGSGSLALASTTSPTVAISGNLVVNEGILNFSTDVGAPTVNVTGNVQLNGGTLRPEGSTGVPVFNVAGNWSDNGGTFNPGSGTVTFTGNSAAINGTAASQTFNNVTVNKTAGQTLSVAGAVTINSTLTLTSGQVTSAAQPHFGQRRHHLPRDRQFGRRAHVRRHGHRHLHHRRRHHWSRVAHLAPPPSRP